MPLISGTVPSLINGISQQPATLRLPTQGAVQENGLSHIARGLEKRPCTEHVALVSDITSENSNDVFIHTIRRSEDEAYALIIKGGVSSYKTFATTDVAIATETITATGHTLTNGDRIQFTTTNTLPAPLVKDTSYFVINSATNTFKVEASVGGGAVNITNVGVGTHTIFLPSQIKLIDLTGFATGTAGNEVYILDQKQTDSYPVGQTSATSAGITSSVAMPSNITANEYFSNFAEGAFKPNSLSATTIADFSFVLNKTTTVKQKTIIPDARPYECLLYYKIGDFGAKYQAVITEWNVGDDGKKSTERNQYKISFDTADNETESRSGAGESSNTASRNNQAGVLVSNIANAIKTGEDASDVVFLVRGFGSGTFGEANYKIFKSESDTDRNTAALVTTHEYDGDKGVKSLGTVTGEHVKETIEASGTVLATWEPVAGGTGTQTTPGLDGLILHNTRFKVDFDPKTSVIHIKNTTYPITVELTDGKGDTYSRAVNGSDEVPNFGYLPGSANIENDFAAKISGDKASGQDDYFVRWTGSVWKETSEPIYPGGLPITGTNVSGVSSFTVPYTLNTSTSDAGLNALKKTVYINIDETTMPMQLFKAFGKVDSVSNGVYFVLDPVPWFERKVGDLGTNPFPSFANYDTTISPDGVYTINDIFFHRNRLGFISDENVILSESGGYFNFFHTTVLSVLDTAVIDVAVSNNQVAILKSAIPFQESLILFSDLQQFKLSSDEFLTPTSVTVDVATNFETSTDAKPVPAGKTIFFPFQRGAFSGIREYFINISSETNDANEITAHVPEYIDGTVKKLAVSSNEEVLLILSETDRRILRIYKYYYNDKEKLQSSWSTWVFDAEIIDMGFIGSIAFFLLRRGTTIYLEKLNLSVDNATNIMDDKIGVRLDRRVKLEWAGSGIGSLEDATPTPTAAWQASQSHTGATGTTSGVGTGAIFSITTDATGLIVTVTVTTAGSAYVDGETVEIEDPGSTSSTAIVTVVTTGTAPAISDFYSDSDHDKLKTSGSIQVTGGKSGVTHGQTLIIKGLNNGTYPNQMLPRIGQRFTSAANAGVTYKVTSSVKGLSTGLAEIEFTPSIAKTGDGSLWADNTVLTFEERETIYVIETGEEVDESKVAGILKVGNDFSKGKGNTTPVVFAGIRYDFRYEFSQQFVKNNDNSINSGRLQMRNFEISYANTGNFEVEVALKPFDNRLRKIHTKAFTAKLLGSLTLGKTRLETGVLRVPIYCNSRDTRVTVTSEAWHPVALQSADWEAYQVLRSQRI